MAVEDFIPLKDIKKTIEKEVKPKPTLAELTKIESPGKPISEDLLENNAQKEKKKKTKRTEKVLPDKIERPKTGIILIITEKPQAAQKIADSLGKARKVSERG